MRLVNAEHRFAMRPGSIPDKDLRSNLHIGSIVKTINLDNNFEVTLAITMCRSDGQYTGRMLNNITFHPLTGETNVHFEDKNIVAIVYEAEEKKSASV